MLFLSCRRTEPTALPGSGASKHLICCVPGAPGGRPLHRLLSLSQEKPCRPQGRLFPALEGRLRIKYRGVPSSAFKSLAPSEKERAH